MCKQWLVTIPKIHAPNLDVLISTTRHYQLTVETDVQAQYRQTVAVQWDVELEKYVLLLDRFREYEPCNINVWKYNIHQKLFQLEIVEWSGASKMQNKYEVV